MDLGLRERRALVMGASSGLGRAIAETLVAEGARVTICARGEDRLRRTAEEIGALPMACDLSAPGAAAELVRSAETELGGLDILVTNTGGPPTGSFAEIDAAAWEAGFRGLWLSASEAIRAALPGMRARGWGRVLLVTSVSAREPIGRLTVSNALRAGLLGLANSLSREVAAEGVTVNALLPGYTRTERLAELGLAEEAMTADVPAGRLAEPEELGALAAFLASARAGYITGQAIACDGGYVRGI